MSSEDDLSAVQSSPPPRACIGSADMPPPAIFTFTSDAKRLRLISVIAATTISLACGTNVRLDEHDKQPD